MASNSLNAFCFGVITPNGSSMTLRSRSSLIQYKRLKYDSFLKCSAVNISLDRQEKDSLPNQQPQYFPNSKSGCTIFTSNQFRGFE